MNPVHSVHGAVHAYATESRLLMGTTVDITVVGHRPDDAVQAAFERAFGAMSFVERSCSRFDGDSALRELCRRPLTPVRVPDILFETLRVALELSELTGGAFDPTVGAALENRGFSRHYLTGDATLAHRPGDERATYRDIVLNEDERTVLLQKPLLLDLGAVAKGLAIDLAARELDGWQGFAVNAGGDLYLRGTDPTGNPWTVGIQHPLHQDAMISRLTATDAAVCTSGSYERRSPVSADAHHLLDPRTGESVRGLLSCTVVAPMAILADSVSTAAFVSGDAERALTLLSGLGLAGLCVDEALAITKNAAMEEYTK